jgi:cellulase (glycosyl hydrolase family 5)
VRAFAVAAVAFAVLATPALGQDRMWVGFHDDPTLRFGSNRQAELDQVRRNNATMVRTLVTWRSIAPTRPANATNSFDRAYRFDDLDEFVRNAQVRGLEVLMTIWGTPGWANGGKAAQFLPKNMNDFKNFCRALASRYSGRTPGYPFVRFYGIWNESNLGNFLSPQFDSKGKVVSPAAYAKLAAAGYSGLKAGNSKALVSIGETSSHGRDKPLAGTTDTTAPATFMKGVAKANKKLKFDAWAHHPYPFPVALPPTQKVRYPNVMLSTMPQFEKDLDTAFGRKNIPVWITEYGHETKPGEPAGITESQQASYLPKAISTAKKDPRVPMFIWFVFRDSPSSLWQSGIYRLTGRAKPAQPKWASAVKPLDMVNGKVTVKGGTKNPSVTVVLREFCANNAIGSVVGANVRTFLGSASVQNSQASAPLAVDCTITVRVTGLTVAKGKTYTVQIDANTAIGSVAHRTITVVGT